MKVKVVTPHGEREERGLIIAPCIPYPKPPRAPYSNEEYERYRARVAAHRMRQWRWSQIEIQVFIGGLVWSPIT